MDPPPKHPIQFIDLDPPNPSPPPKIEPRITQSQWPNEGTGLLHINPNPNSCPIPQTPAPLPNLTPNPNPNPNPSSRPNFVLLPKAAVPLRQISPDPEDDVLYSEHRAAAQLLLLSYAEKLRAASAVAPVEASTSTSTAIVPYTPDPVSFTAPSSTAIVTADAGEFTDVVVARKKQKKKKHARSGEMVRVASADVRELVISRDLVRRTRAAFESLRSLFIRESYKAEVSAGLRNRPDVKAAVLMMERTLWLNRDKRVIGAIPGIHIGDVFFYRMELCVVGLHGQTQAGIDYVAASQSASREPIATSIVVSGGYEDDEDGGDVIIYTGHGGREKNLSRQSIDQKLEAGNLALERSKHYEIEIRVIRGLKSDRSPTGKVYVYDGLYSVVDCWMDAGKSGFSVYKYKLERLKDQVEMGSVIIRWAEELKKGRPTGCLSVDISKGKEKFPVSVFNDIDDDQEPMSFDYFVSPSYTYACFNERRRHMGSGGCECVSNCSVDCYCVARNGGELVYDSNGILSRGKPLIYECGPLCRCPPNCANRVSQKGLKNRFEVFRSLETGWGVRSFDLIPAGSFICEYSGIFVTKTEADELSVQGASLISPSMFPARWTEWGDLSAVFPEYVPPDFPSLPELSFSIDVSRARNVACYLSHSCTPNVFLQFVLFDHHNESFPHLMVFAMENIPPLRELSIDYGVG